MDARTPACRPLRGRWIGGGAGGVTARGLSCDGGVPRWGGPPVKSRVRIHNALDSQHSPSLTDFLSLPTNEMHANKLHNYYYLFFLTHNLSSNSFNFFTRKLYISGKRILCRYCSQWPFTMFLHYNPSRSCQVDFSGMIYHCKSVHTIGHYAIPIIAPRVSAHKTYTTSSGSDSESIDCHHT